MQTDRLLAQIEPHDLMKYGLIPELIGRLPAIVSLDTLDKDALVRILQEPKNALVKQYQTLLALDGVELEFEPEALTKVAEIALARKTGARGLRGVLENVMTDIMFRIPSDETRQPRGDHAGSGHRRGCAAGIARCAHGAAGGQKAG